MATEPRHLDCLPFLIHFSASEIDQHAGAAYGRVEAADAGRAHLPQRRKLLAAGAGPGRRDPRELDRSHPLSEHGTSGGTEERKTMHSSSGLTEAVGRAGPQTHPWGVTLRGS